MTPLSMVPIVYDLAPREGPKIVSTSVLWSDSSVVINQSATGLYTGTVSVNLQQQAQTNQFTTCQSAWIDNSTCPLTIKLISNETSQTTLVEPFSQGFYPIFASTNVSFTIQALYLPPQNATFYANNYLIGTTKFYFINAPCTPYVNLRTNSVNATTSKFGQTFTVQAAGNFITPITAITAPLQAQYAIALSGFNLQMANNGPSTMNGVMGYCLYQAASTATPVNYNPAFYQDVIDTSDAQIAIGWAISAEKRFDPPLILIPGASVWIGPVGTLPAGNVLQINANLQFSLFEVS